MRQIKEQVGIKNKALHVLIFGALFLLIFCYDPGVKADMEIPLPVQAPSGVLVDKNNQEPVIALGQKAKSIQDILLSEDALISFTYLIGETDPEELILAAGEGKKEGLHLLVRLRGEDLDHRSFLGELEEISRYNLFSSNSLIIWISLIPERGLSQKDYDEFYQKLGLYLDKKEINDISLIWYPDGSFPEYQADENQDHIDGVGINISQAGDMAKLDGIYQRFAGKKPIIINENIIDTYAYDIRQGMALLEELYYALAVKYPEVSMVFQTSNLGRADLKYRKAIEELKGKNWVTDLPFKTSNKSMFQGLTPDVCLTGEVEFLYRPHGDSYQDLAYVEYKFNTKVIIQAIRPPFIMKCDTNKLPNGINFLTTVVYNQQGQIVSKEETYFQVENDLIALRAERAGMPYPKEQKPVYTGKYIPVLMYHDFAQQVPRELSSSTVSAELFEKHLKTLLDQGYTPVTFYDLSQYLNKAGGLPPKPVIITTDDGYLSNYTIAYPLLKKYRIPATFFVTTGFMGVTTQFAHIDWEMAREMEESGFIDIQSHTHGHRILSELPEAEVRYETSISFGLIEKNLGKRDVKVLAYPEFKNTPDSKRWLQEQGVIFQVTNLANKQSVTSWQNVQRIHVHNGMSPQALINAIRKLTM